MKIVMCNNRTIKRVSFYMKSEKSRDSHFFNVEVQGAFFSLLFEELL